MQTVLDCNIIISAGITDGNCRNVIKEIVSNHRNFLSEPILLEYKKVILREKFISYRTTLVSLIKIICDYSTLINIDDYTTIHSLPDRHDEIYLKTSLKAKADYLITGNLKDYPSGQYDVVRIIDPKEFLRLSNR